MSEVGVCNGAVERSSAIVPDSFSRTPFRALTPEAAHHSRRHSPLRSNASTRFAQTARVFCREIAIASLQALGARVWGLEQEQLKVSRANDYRAGPFSRARLSHGTAVRRHLPAH